MARVRVVSDSPLFRGPSESSNTAYETLYAKPGTIFVLDDRRAPQGGFSPIITEGGGSYYRYTLTQRDPNPTKVQKPAPGKTIQMQEIKVDATAVTALAPPPGMLLWTASANLQLLPDPPVARFDWRSVGGAVAIGFGAIGAELALVSAAGRR